MEYLISGTVTMVHKPTHGRHSGKNLMLVPDHVIGEVHNSGKIYVFSNSCLVRDRSLLPIFYHIDIDLLDCNYTDDTAIFEIPSSQLDNFRF